MKSNIYELSDVCREGIQARSNHENERGGAAAAREYRKYGVRENSPWRKGQAEESGGLGIARFHVCAF